MNLVIFMKKKSNISQQLERLQKRQAEISARFSAMVQELGIDSLAFLLLSKYKLHTIQSRRTYVQPQCVEQLKNLGFSQGRHFSAKNTGGSAGYLMVSVDLDHLLLYWTYKQYKDVMPATTVTEQSFTALKKEYVILYSEYIKIPAQIAELKGKQRIEDSEMTTHLSDADEEQEQLLKTDKTIANKSWSAYWANRCADLYGYAKANPLLTAASMLVAIIGVGVASAGIAAVARQWMISHDANVGFLGKQ